MARFTDAVAERLNKSDPVRSALTGVGLGTLLQDQEKELAKEIAGTWYYVDPTDGSDSDTGLSLDTALANLQAAYAKCVSGAGDGIRLYSRGTSSSGTTSYLATPLTWSKWGITVVGLCAPTMMAQRARISNVNRTTGALTTLAFPSATTITDSAAGFLTAEFAIGNLLEIVTTDGTNDGQAVITGVTAGTITCSGSTFTIQTAATAGSSTIDTYMTHLIEVSGSNNTFSNVHLANYDSDDLSVGALKVSGNRNAFINVHAYGAGNATPAATTGAYDLQIEGEENTFYSCVFGSDTIVRAAANANIRFDTNSWRNIFVSCTIRCHSETAGKGAIMCVDATGIEGIQEFHDCLFSAWKPNGMPALTSAFIGTKPTSGQIAMMNCMLMGWAAWDSVGGNDTVYVNNAAAAASGGGSIATTP